MKRFKRPVIIASLVLIIIAIIAAQIVRYPTYEYYGKLLSVDEFVKLVENETPLNCTPRSDAAIAIDFVCFNTVKEVDAYLDTKRG